jgi:hypothetical protein
MRDTTPTMISTPKIKLPNIKARAEAVIVMIPTDQYQSLFFSVLKCSFATQDIRGFIGIL